MKQDYKNKIMESEEILPELPEYSEEILPNNPEVECPDEGASIEVQSTEVPGTSATETETLEIKESAEATETTVQAQTSLPEKTVEKSNEPRLTQLPLTRIKNLMKLDPDLQIASMESVFLITKATELFIDSLAKESFVHTAQAKKKTVQKRDVDLAISSVDSLMFLEGASF